MEEDGWQLISSNRTGWSIITITACPTRILQLWKRILLKVKKKNRFGGQTERGQCADVSSVKDEAVLRCCCCCWDQDLCYCCYCQPERGYLWKEAYWGKAACVWVFVCISFDVSVNLRNYGECACACEVSGQRRMAGEVGRKHFFSSLLPVFLCSFPSRLSRFIYLFYLCVSHIPLLLQQQGMTLKCGEHGYIMGAGRWATSACIYLLITVCANSLCYLSSSDISLCVSVFEWELLLFVFITRVQFVHRLP